MIPFVLTAPDWVRLAGILGWLTAVIDAFVFLKFGLDWDKTLVYASLGAIAGVSAVQWTPKIGDK